MEAPNIDEEDKEDWLVTYADAITLLMAFFVLLVSFSKVDVSIYEQVAAGIKNEIGNRDVESPIKALERTVQTVVNEMQASQVVSIGTDDRGLVIDMEGSALFKPGTAQIRAEAVLFLTKLGETLDQPKFRGYTVEIEGHTDNIPINTDKFPSNWELSSARASTVVRFLVSQDFDPRRLKASGYADTRPKLPNNNATGEALPENMQKNRRISARISPMSLEERKKLLSKAARKALEAEEAAMQAEAAARAAAEAARKAGMDVDMEPMPGAGGASSTATDGTGPASGSQQQTDANVPGGPAATPREAEKQNARTPSLFDRVAEWVNDIYSFFVRAVPK